MYTLLFYLFDVDTALERHNYPRFQTINKNTGGIYCLCPKQLYSLYGSDDDNCAEKFVKIRKALCS